MAMRAVALNTFCKSKSLRNLIFFSFFPQSHLHKPSFCDVIHKGLGHAPCETERYIHGHISWYHSTPSVDMMHKVIEPAENTTSGTVANGSGESKPKRKKLKGKRAVVRWLKFFRFKKKKDYERMTAEEKILFKLRKARKKEETLVEALKKIEPKESSETTHDPEILTPEEHFYFLKMGKKSKNYVPVGRRGIYQGVILNMHLHWKKHETLQVVVKTFTPDEVKDMAAELARLSGGIVLHIQDDNVIIMYRGKNYSQPPTEIMSPRVTLPRKKALDKSKYTDALRSVRRHIPKLEQELELLRARATVGDAQSLLQSPDNTQFEATKKLQEIVSGNSDDHSEFASDSEDLSDMFETDDDDDEVEEERVEKAVYLDEFEKVPAVVGQGQISATRDKDLEAEFDEVDRVVLRAASLLKKKRR